MLVPGTSPLTVFAGTELTFNVPGMRPLEKGEVTLVGPNGSLENIGEVRANLDGFVALQRDSTKDAAGAWTLHVDGDLGTRVTVPYALAELELSTLTLVEGGTEFRVYRTPGADFYFVPSLRTAAVRRVADIVSSTLASVPPMLGTTVKDHLNVYLVPNGEALRREVTAGGAESGAGLEAGVSLYGFKRSGVYIDMSNSLTTLPHITAHEITHQINARLEGDRDIPHWLEEGLAEYAGTRVSQAHEPDQERHWRRRFRQLARGAAQDGGWLPLADLAAPSVWYRESDARRGLLYYAEGYAAVDYVATTYGERALRPLFDRLAQDPQDPEAAFKAVLGVGVGEFERAVQASLSEQDDYEREVQSMIDSARSLLATVGSEAALHKEWDAYRGDRAKLTRSERMRRLSVLAGKYRQLAAAIDPSQGAFALMEPRTLYHRAFADLQTGMQGIAAYESTGRAADLDKADATMTYADRLLAAAADRLAAILASYAIGPAEVEQIIPLTPTPAGA